MKLLVPTGIVVIRTTGYDWLQVGYAPLRKVVVAPNGDIFVGSTGQFPASTPSGLEADVIVGKVFADGSLDRLERSNVAGIDDQLVGLALTSDGKVLVAGGTASGAGQDMVVQRYNPNLSLDATFDGDGSKVFDGGGLFGDVLTAVAELPDGKILAMGDRYEQGDTGAVFVRLEATGALDTSFGQSGFPAVDLPEQGWVQFMAFELDSSNRIVATGRGNTGFGEYSDVLLARLLPDGTPDTSFGNNGMVLTSVGEEVDIGLDLILEPDGRIVVAGHRTAGNGTYQDAVMLRHHG